MRQYFRKTVVRTMYWLIGYLNFYTTLWTSNDITRDMRIGANIVNNSSYDFIVVGSGSAGAVVAARLSAKYNVLLLEAGGEPFPLTDIPVFSLFLLEYPALDWKHRTVPQENACLASNKQESGWSQGKALGGTSTLNFLIHSRGHPKDFDSWADIIEDKSWNFEGVLPYFKKSEDFHGEYLMSEYHGVDGPMRLEQPLTHNAVPFYMQALQELGYPKVDVNGNFSYGFDRVYCPIKKGRRQSTYTSYLKPIRKRSSLTIQKYSHVNKILLQNGNEAYGVEFNRHGKTEQVFAKKEVILSAGAIQSPKLLMLSGIGDRNHLESLNIESKIESPKVGQNLQDHISVYLGPFFINPGLNATYNFDRDFNVRELHNFYRNARGPLVSSGIEVIGFLPVPTDANEIPDADRPNIQYLMSGFNIFENIGQFDMFARSFNLKSDVIQEYYTHALGKDFFFVIVSLARPLQRGEILLKSSDPHDSLRIDPKYLQNQQDVSVLVAGIKKIVEIVEMAPTFKKIGATFTKKPFPGCGGVSFRSDKYWECLIRQFGISLHHIVGTCAMSKRGDKVGGVVDPELRVIGAKNLRVIDASIMPTVPIGNTNAPTVMIGEKGADIILKHWKQIDI